ncbi:MAG: hypothetical protein HQL56_08055 [Magnetococcales bacterium]|nr:hypothetical protein [Magnetococcales bacterium]
MMARWAVINPQGLVVNIAEWDGRAGEWEPPEGYFLRRIKGTEDPNIVIGSQYDPGTESFISPLQEETA